MKRGLKVKVDIRDTLLKFGYNRFPDEKGTESHNGILTVWRELCYNRFPDEKGTERSSSALKSSRLMSVTTVSPMKRGLKVSIPLA